MKRRYVLALALLFAAFLSLVVPLRGVTAQQPTPSDDQVNAIASQLYCPVCENTPLDVCPTTACHQWRELIRKMISEGKSETEIKQYFVEYYGARVLAEPPRIGINWLVYVVPPVAFLIGVYLLFRAFQTWKHVKPDVKPEITETNVSRSGKKPGGQSIPNGEMEYIARIEEALKKRG